jgi:hypothetical protein
MIGLTISTASNDWDRIANGLGPKVTALVEETLEHVREHVETAMELPKSGNVYGTHVASQPGEPPAIESGNLVESAAIAMESPTVGSITYTSDHAAAMEYGTVHIAPRPFLTPGIEAERAAFNAAISDLLER